MTESTKTTTGEDNQKFGGEAPPNSAQIPAAQNSNDNVKNGYGAVDAVTQTNPTSNTSNSDYSSDTFGSLSPMMQEILDLLSDICEKAYYGSSGVLNPAFTALDAAHESPNTKIEDLKNELVRALMS